MRALFSILTPLLLVAQAPLIAQQPPAGQPPGQLDGLFNSQQGPAVNYMGYSYGQCTAESAPSVRIVALLGLVPEGVPASPPRPSIELVIPLPADKVVGEYPIAPTPAAGSAQALSCPVVGDCAPARSGTITIASRAENGSITGQFRAQWGTGAPRAGKFTVPWRQSGAKCG